MFDFWKMIAKAEAIAAIAEQEHRARMMEAMKPHNPPVGLHRRKTIIPYARANLPAGCRGQEVIGSAAN